MKLRAAEWVVAGGSAAIAAFAALVGVLIYLKPPPARYAYQEDAHTRAGEAVYRREGCGSCHRLLGNGPSYGPALDGEGARRSGAWLLDYLRQPRPGIGDRPYRLQMPSYAHLQESELQALAAYLQAQRAPQ